MFIIYIITKEALNRVITLDDINFTVTAVEIVIDNFRIGWFKAFGMQNFVTLSTFKELMADVNRFMTVTAEFFP